MPRLAASVALRMASGTSRALPWPKPTRPFWSPTTTRAAKPKRRPPFTTLATRLMWTSLSTNSLSRSSRSPRRSLGSLAIYLLTSGSRLARATVPLARPGQNPSSEIQPAFARGVGECLDAPVIQVARPVEDDLGHAGLLGPLREQPADLGRSLDIGTGLELAAHVRLECRGGCQRVTALVIDDLGVDLLRGPVDRQPRTAIGRLADGPADSRFAPIFGAFLLSHVRRPTSSCLP